jgi:hypothetical protein
MRKRHQTDGCDAVDWKRQLRHRNAHGAIQHDEQPEKAIEAITGWRIRSARDARTATSTPVPPPGKQTQPETELSQRVADFT